MAVIRSGATTDEWTIEPTFKAGRVTTRPAEYGAFGQYRQGRRFLMNTSQAAGALWEFQWTSASAIAILQRVTLKGVQIANATAEELRFNLKIARSFTAADTTNTASILPSGNNQKLRTSMATTAATAIRESNSATAATGGTKTLDTDSIAQGSFVSIATVSTTVPSASIIFDYAPISNLEHPAVFAQNEGWVISLEVTKGATQGVVLIMEHQWLEAAAY